ncbi:DUF4232 domain-containing protein [Streptomyces sp. NPDC001568]|uniref:DUF4232 domain-containing protein n=1 Tax=Streptomyces sp. NPDC001568 TaxID=3364588 RepID=UPI0036B6759F
MVVMKRWVRGVVLTVGLVAVAGCGTGAAGSGPAAPSGLPTVTPGASAMSGMSGAPKVGRLDPSAPVYGAPVSPGAPGASGSGSGSSDVCPEGGVRLLEGAGDAAMGLRVAEVQLVNCGTKPYVLNGHPQVRVLDRQRRPVEVSVAPGSNGVATGTGLDAAPQRVTLQPGQAARMGLVWRNLVTDPTVPVAEGWVLDVVPRPGAPRQTLELGRSIDLGNTGRLGIGPWTAVTR